MTAILWGCVMTSQEKLEPKFIFKDKEHNLLIKGSCVLFQDRQPVGDECVVPNNVMYIGQTDEEGGWGLENTCS